MSVARAEAALAAALLIELMVAVAEEDDRGEAHPAAPVPSAATFEPLAAAA